MAAVAALAVAVAAVAAVAAVVAVVAAVHLVRLARLGHLYLRPPSMLCVPRQLPHAPRPLLHMHTDHDSPWGLGCSIETFKALLAEISCINFTLISRVYHRKFREISSVRLASLAPWLAPHRPWGRTSTCDV